MKLIAQDFLFYGEDEVTTIKLTEIQIVPVKPKNGLIAFVSFVLNESFFIGDVAVHSRLDQQGYRLVYPTKILFNGLKINCFKPIKREAAQAIEEQVLNEFDNLIEKVKKTEEISHGQYDRFKI